MRYLVQEEQWGQNVWYCKIESENTDARKTQGKVVGQIGHVFYSILKRDIVLKWREIKKKSADRSHNGLQALTLR